MANFPTAYSHSAPALQMFTLVVRGETFTVKKLESWGYPPVKDLSLFDTIPACDGVKDGHGQTDRQTDRARQTDGFSIQ